MNEQLAKQEVAKNLLKASVHYGHRPKEWNPKMAPYILQEKYGYHIFNIVKTSKMLKLAGNILEKKAEKGGRFLFVGTDKVSAPIIKKGAEDARCFYINYRWLGGMLTNWPTIQKRIERLKSLEEKEAQGLFTFLSKKEYAAQKKEIEKLNRIFHGIKNMKFLPDAVIFTNQLKDSLAIHECLKLGIPTIAVVDSNCNPDLIPYPIPANDDSSSSISFIINYLVKRIFAGYNIKHEENV
jgi:small subunit ribosomal protein S2